MVSVQKIYDRINLAIQQNNTLEVWYQFGRILNILLVFPPIAQAGNPQYAVLQDDTVLYTDHFSELLSYKIQSKEHTDSNVDFVNIYNNFISNNDRVISALNNAYHQLENVDMYCREQMGKSNSDLLPKAFRKPNLRQATTNTTKNATVLLKQFYNVGIGFITTTVDTNNLNSSNFLTILDNYYSNISTRIAADLNKKTRNQTTGLWFCFDTSYLIRNVNTFVAATLWLAWSADLEYRGYYWSLVHPAQLGKNIVYKFGNIYDRLYEVLLF